MSEWWGAEWCVEERNVKDGNEKWWWNVGDDEGGGLDVRKSKRVRRRCFQRRASFL